MYALICGFWGRNQDNKFNGKIQSKGMKLNHILTFWPYGTYFNLKNVTISVNLTQYHTINVYSGLSEDSGDTCDKDTSINDNDQ